MPTASAPLKIPRVSPQRKPRTPQENIPTTREEREMMLREVRHYVAEQTLVPPVPIADLKEHVQTLNNLYHTIRDFYLYPYFGGPFAQ